mgnify:CR=1 FL=1
MANEEPASKPPRRGRPPKGDRPAVAVAEETGRPVPQVALNWLLQRPTVSTILIGARNEEQLRDNLGAVGWSLSAAQVAHLDAASANDNETAMARAVAPTTNRAVSATGRVAITCTCRYEILSKRVAVGVPAYRARPGRRPDQLPRIGLAER